MRILSIQEMEKVSGGSGKHSHRPKKHHIKAIKNHSSTCSAKATSHHCAMGSSRASSSGAGHGCGGPPAP